MQWRIHCNYGIEIPEVWCLIGLILWSFWPETYDDILSFKTWEKYSFLPTAPTIFWRGNDRSSQKNHSADTVRSFMSNIPAISYLLRAHQGRMFQSNSYAFTFSTTHFRRLFLLLPLVLSRIFFLLSILARSRRRRLRRRRRRSLRGGQQQKKRVCDGSRHRS